MATCNTPIGKGALSFMCDLPSGHDGPHRAHGNDRSLRERADWEEAQAVLSQTQGKPMTSAERWGSDEIGPTGTPPPGFFPCAYHKVIHHNDVRSPKCIAWSGPHDGPKPTRIQRLPEFMGTSTAFGPLPDMEDDSQQTRPAQVFEARGNEMVPKPSDRAVADVGVGRTVEKQPTDPSPGDERYRPSEDQYAKTHDRPGDQPMPIPNDRKVAHEILIEMVQGRLDLGIQRYGTGLQPFNGRNSTVDALEELVDLAVYLVVHNGEKAELHGLVTELRPMVGMSIRGNEIIDRLLAYFEGSSA